MPAIVLYDLEGQTRSIGDVSAAPFPRPPHDRRHDRATRRVRAPSGMMSECLRLREP